MKMFPAAVGLWTALIITAAPLPAEVNLKQKPVLFLIGDSTVHNRTPGQLGWGDSIVDWFDPAKIAVTNLALGGRSSRTFLTEGLWDKALAELRPGDFVLMQFGHNDAGPLDEGRARASLKGNGDESSVVTNKISGKVETVHTYGWYLRKYISEAKAKAATPIVLSPVPRKIWKDGKIVRASNDYGKWAAEAARAGGALFVDLNDIVARHYEALGPEKVTALFGDEHTHTSPEGAKLNARCVVEGLRARQDCPLTAFLLPNPEGSGLVELASRRVRTHDPSSILRCGDEYWVFATGNGIASWRSKDLLNWVAGPRVFTNPPAWTTNLVPGNRGYFWAPDVIHFRDRYLLYYSVSTWGKNTSAIGLAANPTLNPAATNFAWSDGGLVLRSSSDDDFNTIDPSVTTDASGNLWLAFGSFWSGIKLVQLDPETGRRLAPGSPIYSLAAHDQIEAACLYAHGGRYYLFVNWGYCCRGVNSTYNIRVGRSDHITGPYLDRNGVDLLTSGGTLLLGSRGAFIGPGHAGILSREGADWLSCHFYDGTRGGIPTLALVPLRWEASGWPEIIAQEK